MKSRIKVLSDDLISKIAAGEVVERPASVIKELVENSIDAGATRIKIIVVNGGKTLMQVIDNGSGMTEDDALLALERHATSKINSYEDLVGVMSLGFRGEALPSIASVSRLELLSSVKDAETGTKITVAGGSIRSVVPSEAIPGTSVTIKNLFYATPARRKFLKSPQVEYRHILEAVKRFALGRPEIAFEFYNGEKKVFQTRKSDLLERIGETFHRSYIPNLKEVTGSGRTLKLNGYVGDPKLIRKSRGEQYLYLNGRYISDRKMSSAVYKGYGDLVSRGEFPFFVINLVTDPRSVDVNVHPSKMEAKFKNEWDVYETIKTTVHDTVHIGSAGMIDSFKPVFEEQAAEIEDSRIHHSSKIIQFMPSRTIPPAPELSDMTSLSSADIVEKEEGFSPAVETYKSAFPELQSEPGQPEGLVWQMHNKYIISQVKSGLSIIDQHVAHERILYEKALSALESGSGYSQQLLFPQKIELSPEDYSVLLEILAFMNKIGFEITEFGERTILVQAVPADIKAGTEGKVLAEIIDNFRETSGKEVPAHKALAASFACKAAVKAGEKLTQEEMISLIERLFMTEYPYYCPHGRPVIINLTIDELDKRFERK
ncbi:MAG: DNA mismatch repair endonuclease MutL [Candidatus Marinimicrobia bacterium]|nr:DNA mismatch repair endonuclease MutL [Candidatus Neomarinimicrobiota bacterium]